ncbi:hypothetical protein FQS90_09570 [Enterococcus casseliflavus]|uniref:YopX family protein n=1 Tax=Enterococcus sp. 8E11_MSG4843 TaxID=1834190 RepID=UPI000B3E66E0|nr:YopX family protein [Enterococcus sp. 8E11_MSG4843]MBO1096771.1 hypothetical protein [Enterococcus casseliflavus]MBO1145093.1 hypothetical protein [Enterococcus casseliflavus]OUZ36767.1 hypothetical protein A5885_000956 [Enterococcus sp. 8E11_MSG4843]
MVPKYRCWDERVGLTEVVSIDFFRKKIKINHWEYGNSNFFPLDEVVLMQSTGLKDKNGVEIFEGDVLLHTSSSVNYSDTYWHSYVQVYRIDSGAYRIKGKHIYDTELMSARNRLEVVGNIYQNQNLLDKEYFSTSDGIVEQADEN